ncbi:MBL fold metallo-hydrolase [Lysinibacter cavernae]|uniref:MBL fold metallo-hydrolase n=1 Tax=Lysinibacter cavernae TaxID=1640652 RepID=UPI0014202EAF|nr:MBL fold metallo-hydrolase [Lysinibacter cavernae]
MRLTKFEHAALLLEEDGKKLFLDPGNMTTALTDTEDAVAVVITHEHADHWTPAQLERILDRSPDAPIFGTAAVVDAIRAALPEANAIAVRAGDEHTAGPFTLRFYGEKHAVIHRSIPIIDNVGVLVNGELYYGGDTLVPEPALVGEVNVLAVPAGAPWLLIGDVIDYVISMKPRRTFATHDMGLSQWGQNMASDRIRSATEIGGGEFIDLEPFDSYDV